MSLFNAPKIAGQVASRQAESRPQTQTQPQPQPQAQPQSRFITPVSQTPFDATSIDNGLGKQQNLRPKLITDYFKRTHKPHWSDEPEKSKKLVQTLITNYMATKPKAALNLDAKSGAKNVRGRPKGSKNVAKEQRKY